MTINKTIKNKIDNFKVWDYIEELDLTISEIDWDYYTVIRWDNFMIRDSWELFTDLYEHYQEEKANS